MPRGYVPDAGDITWLQFDPQAGHEQAGLRAAVVLSPASSNGRTGMILCCPTTTRIKDYPFGVALDGSPPSVVLADQLKSQDWRRLDTLARAGDHLREMAGDLLQPKGRTGLNTAQMTSA